jgi:hypothetical protein
MHRYGTNGYF